MIAADDLAAGAAQDAHQAKLLGGIEFETIRIMREVANGMDDQCPHHIVFATPFDQPASFAWERCTRVSRDCIPQRLRQEQSRDHFAGAADFTCPTSRPDSVSMMSISSPEMFLI